MKSYILAALFASLTACSDRGSHQNAQNSENTQPTTGESTRVVGSNEASVETAVIDSPKPSPFTVRFRAAVKGEDLKCFDKTPAMLDQGQIFTDVRMFISNVTLIDDKGQAIPLILDVAENSSNLQFVDRDQNSLALLNFLDPSCARSDATKKLKDAITGVLPQGVYKEIRFQLGLPYPASDSRLVAVPSALAPTDMGWMWEHFPADLQLEVGNGSGSKLFNALTSANKKVISLPLALTHGAAESLQIDIDLEKIFQTSAADFVAGIDQTCDSNPKPLADTASPSACAYAFKALGLDVSHPVAPYTQSVFSIRK